MAELATECQDVKLDWVDQVTWGLAHRDALDRTERLAEGWRERGVRHVIWSGMGGSIQTVHVLKQMGFLDRQELIVHPLDGTDPAALNRLLGRIGALEGAPLTRAGLAPVLRRTLMVAVSMGMTSEEPITHCEWFRGLLREMEIAEVAQHLMVMTLPGSFLDRFAGEVGAPTMPVQLNAQSHIPGRMSAPSTRVFLLPAALALAGRPALAPVLEHCQAEYRLGPGLSADERADLAANDPFIGLAAWLTMHLEQGRNKVLLDLSPRYQGLAPWVEQVVEESLGKGGRGLLIFHDQDREAARRWPDEYVVLEISEERASFGPPTDRPVARLRLPPVDGDDAHLGLLARLFAGWSLAVSILSYFSGIPFAGQPAVEAYKRYARELRDAGGRLPYPDRVVTDRRGLSLHYDDPMPAGDDPAEVLAGIIQQRLQEGRLGYFDVTLNADPDGPAWEGLRSRALSFAGTVLRRPAKVRSGPRDYHATEQSETDGPDELLSLRVLVRRPEPVALGDYSDRFLHAQALGTMRAMRDAGRPIVLAMVERTDDVALVSDLLDRTAELLASSPTGSRFA
jgi:glucose-6-phosphate isomerase